MEDDDEEEEEDEEKKMRRRASLSNGSVSDSGPGRSWPSSAGSLGGPSAYCSTPPVPRGELRPEPRGRRPVTGVLWGGGEGTSQS